jgi:dGTPase
VEILEKDGKGLNLTFEVRDGISKHSKGKGKVLCEDPEAMASTVEGQVVCIADIIAYINHDIDDAIRGEIISPNDIPEDCLKYLGSTHSKRINTMVSDIIQQTLRSRKTRLSISKEVLSSILNLREFLWERVYENEAVHADFHKATKILKELYQYLVDHPNYFLTLTKMEALYDSLERCVCDFLAGMTDRYAFNLYEKVFLPLPWVIL